MKELDPNLILTILANSPDPTVRYALENAVLVAQNQMLMETLGEIQPDLFETEVEDDESVDSELRDDGIRGPDGS